MQLDAIGIRRGEKRNNMIREKQRFTELVEVKEGQKEEEEEEEVEEQTTERARREQTLMPPCRPQMLHQLQTSSFLRSPSFPASQPQQIEKERERERDICRIQTYHILPSFSCSSLPSSFNPLTLSLVLSTIFSLSHLSTPSYPRAMTSVIRRRKGGKGKGRGRCGGPTRHEFSIKFNTRRERMLGRRCARRCFR